MWAVPRGSSGTPRGEARAPTPGHPWSKTPRAQQSSRPNLPPRPQSAEPNSCFTTLKAASPGTPRSSTFRFPSPYFNTTYGSDVWDPNTKLSLKEGGLISHWPLAEPFKCYLRPRMSDQPITQETQLNLALEAAKRWSKQKYKKGTKVVGSGTTAPQALIPSEKLANTKRYVPGFDGDFHSTATNNGYGRTPYGGYYSSFK